MNKQKSSLKFSKYKEFVSTEITIHFIYTFLFTGFDIEQKIDSPEKEDKLSKLIKSKLQEREEDKLKVAVQIHWTGKDPRSERYHGFYLDPYLHLKMSRIEVEYLIADNLKLFKWSQENNKYLPTNIKINVKNNINIFESGQGTLDLKINLYPIEKELFNTENIVHLSNLGMRRKTLSVLNNYKDKNLDLSEYKLVKDNQEIFLFEFFFKAILEIKSIFKLIFGDKIEWIEANPKLKLVGDIDKFGTTLHFQDPFPILILTFPDKVYSHSFLDIDQATKFLEDNSILTNDSFFHYKKELNKELLTLVFRSKGFGYPDSSFAKYFCHFDNDRMINMCSNSLVFLYIYSRTGIAIQAQNITSQKHSKYIIPAFVETVKYLRMRWHTYVVASQWLDRIIEYLSKNEPPFKETLDMIIDSRRDISRALCDPITYRLGSGSTYNIYDVGLTIFRIEDLEKIITKKLDMIDRLYSNLFEKERIEVSEEISKKYLKL